MWQVVKIPIVNNDYSERIAEIVKFVGADGVSEEWGEKEGYFVKGFWHDADIEAVKKAAEAALKISLEGGIIDIAPEIEITEMADDDWLIGWRQYFSPFEISDRLAVTPSWENYTPKPGQEVIVLDPGMAFGTGTHGTTYTCLCALSDYLAADMTVCDIGTGSGILAFAAKKLGAQTVKATDNDPLAIKVAKENEIVNGLGNAIDFEVADLFTDVKPEKFDLVIANILAPVIMELTPKINLILKPGGLFISSGYILSQEQMITEEFERCGFEIVQRYSKDGWVTIVSLLPF